MFTIYIISLKDRDGLKALNSIKSYEKSGGFTKVTFNNGKTVFVKMTTGSFETQILRASRLASLLKKRLQ